MRMLTDLRLTFDIWLARRSGLFDNIWYCERYPDILAANVDPLTHFMTFGYREGRDPNQIFDTKCEKPEIFRKRNPWFDPVWYAQIHALPRALDPMLHYLTRGAAERNLPCAEFLHPLLYEHCAAAGCPASYFWHRYAVTGAVGFCTSYYITGWAHRYVGAAINLTISINGLPTGTVKPWIARRDVKEVLGRDDALGFLFVFPTRLRSGDKIEIHDEFHRPLSVKPITYTIAPLGTTNDLYGTRASVAASFLKGKGIEIGPYTQPTDLSPDCDVVFNDRLCPRAAQ
jgi:hypothetical protein